jgi:hypothetical protein
MRDSLVRWTPLTGIVFVGLIVGAFVAGGSTPNSDASAQKVVSYYEAHRSAQIASSILVVYSVVFGVFFYGVLRSYLRTRSAENGLVTVGFAGGMLFGAGAAVLASVNFAAADVPGKISPAAEQALNVGQNDLFFLLLAGIAVTMIANGLAIARSAALPRWLGWVAILIGIVAATPIGWFSLLATMGWVLVVSVLMYLRQGGTSAAAAPSAA